MSYLGSPSNLQLSRLMTETIDIRFIVSMLKRESGTDLVCAWFNLIGPCSGILSALEY